MILFLNELELTFLTPQYCYCFFIVIYKYIYLQLIGIVGRVFANGLGDRGSIIVQVIPKTQKMGLDATLLNT